MFLLVGCLLILKVIKSRAKTSFWPFNWMKAQLCFRQHHSDTHLVEFIVSCYIWIVWAPVSDPATNVALDYYKLIRAFEKHLWFTSGKYHDISKKSYFPVAIENLKRSDRRPIIPIIELDERSSLNSTWFNEWGTMLNCSAYRIEIETRMISHWFFRFSIEMKLCMEFGYWTSTSYRI